MGRYYATKICIFRAPYLLVAFSSHIDRLHLNGTRIDTVVREIQSSIRAIDYHFRLELPVVSVTL